MEGNTNRTKKWAAYYEAQKNVWHNPDISVYAKCFLRLLELHRGDARGWSLSIRLVSKYLGIAPNTARKVINEALQKGLIETDTLSPRKRRKLKLSASLRAPVESKNLTLDLLDHQLAQPVIPPNTDSESPNEPVNNKEKDINANTEKSQVKPNEKIEESNPYKEGVSHGLSQPERLEESDGYRKLREKMKELGWREKS